jgi:TPR repeat protein
VQCKQKPGTEDGKPVTMWMLVHYYWTIDQAEDQLRQRLAREALDGSAASRYKLGAFVKSRAKSEDEWRRGMELIINAAELGDSMAQVALAMEYESGANVETDMNMAVKWYMKAAEQGNVFAVDHLRSLNPVRVPRP